MDYPLPSNNEHNRKTAMKKIFILAMLVLALAAVAPGQAQAGTCTCKCTTLSFLYLIFGLPIYCGSGSTGGNKDAVVSNLSDSEVTGHYIQQYQLAINAYNNGQDGYDWIHSGWSCHK
jgi:hypothetical protein